MNTEFQKRRVFLIPLFPLMSNQTKIHNLANLTLHKWERNITAD